MTAGAFRALLATVRLLLPAAVFFLVAALSSEPNSKRIAANLRIWVILISGE